MINTDKIVIVGGSSGIGLKVAKMASDRGATVVVASRSAESKKDELKKLLGSRALICSFDITSMDNPTHFPSHFMDQCRDAGHLIITVRPDLTASPFVDSNIEEVKRGFDTKFWGQYRLIQLSKEYMQNLKSITMTSGIAGRKIIRGLSAMAVINSATETLCRALSVELAPVRVNVVSPGFVEPKPENVSRIAEGFPVKGLIPQDEVAKLYLNIITSRYITGTVSIIDGGALLV